MRGIDSVTLSMFIFGMAWSASAQGPDRMPPIAADKLTAAQKTAISEFKTARSAEISGPFVPLLRSPEAMMRVRALGDYMRFRSALPPRLSEFVILLTGALLFVFYQFEKPPPIFNPVALERLRESDHREELASLDGEIDLVAAGITRHQLELGAEHLVHQRRNPEVSRPRAARAHPQLGRLRLLDRLDRHRMPQRHRARPRGQRAEPLHLLRIEARGARQRHEQGRACRILNYRARRTRQNTTVKPYYHPLSEIARRRLRAAYSADFARRLWR